jgi:hypothetical protein
MAISLKTLHCCPLPTLANIATITDCDATVKAPYRRDDTDVACSTATCRGAWALRSLPNIFSAGAATTTDRCGYGQKNAVSKKVWPGRYGFMDDYIANPKVDVRFTGYSVSVAAGFSTSNEYIQYNSDGSIYCDVFLNESNSGLANSQHSLTVGGFETCTGDADCGDGSYSATPSVLCSPDGPGPEKILLVPNDPIYANPSEQAAARATNIATLKSWCAINGDRGTVSIPIPGLPTYVGPVAGLGAYLAGFNQNQNTSQCSSDHSTVLNIILSQAYALSDFVVTNTSISGKIVLTYNLHALHYGVASYDPTTGICTPGALTGETKDSGTFTFSFAATLSGAVTFKQMCDAAKTLLNTFDFTKDAEFPWQTPGDCRVSPMVSLWELPGSPSTGYCDTTPDAATLAVYDGSVRGALLNYYGQPVGVYNKGWFDYAMDFYNYSDPGTGNCTDQLCYQYGDFVTNFTGVTMATQVVTGAGDTCECGPGWSPFSRYLVNWLPATRPPFVDVSCGYIADGGDAIYAAKWAEKKVPLPSQNYWGACGAQRTKTLLDSHCNATATKRWPAAWSICGKASIASMSRDSGSGVVTVLLTDAAPALITGDVVDFIDANNAVTTASVTVTVDNANQFHFTGALPTGVAVMSHGAPNPVWYDTSPRGDFVWLFQQGDGASATTTAVQDTVTQRQYNAGAILAVLPAGSPELGNPAWVPKLTYRSDYPDIAPGEHWYCLPQQAMADRFFTDKQDNSMNDGTDPTPPGGACTRLVPPPQVPFVEARLIAPTGAPHDFHDGDGNIEMQMPGFLGLGDTWSFRCSGIWNATYAFTRKAYQYWPGVNRTATNATGDQHDTGHDASEMDAGLGTA